MKNNVSREAYQEMALASKSELLNSFGEKLAEFYKSGWVPAKLDDRHRLEFLKIFDSELKMEIAFRVSLELVAQMLAHDLVRQGSKADQQQIFASVNREIMASTEEYKLYFLAMQESKDEQRIIHT